MGQLVRAGNELRRLIIFGEEINVFGGIDRELALFNDIIKGCLESYQVFIDIGRGQAEPFRRRGKQLLQLRLDHIPGNLFHRQIGPYPKPTKAFPVIGVTTGDFFVVLFVSIER